MSELESFNSRIDGLTQEFNIIAHNLANVSTAGYKRKCNTFSKSLAAQGLATGEEPADEIDLKTTFDFSQGELVQTGRTLDLALCGKGFFVIETPDGALYTRNGVFQRNQNNQIVNSSGRIVSGQGGPITIPANAGLSQISISSDGNISANGTPIGKLRLVDFKDDENKLLPAGLNCFQAPEDITPQPAANLIVKQGFQESSNVQLVKELVDMIMVSRLYEANMKFVEAQKERSKSIIGVAMG